MFALFKKKVRPPSIAPAPRPSWVPIGGDTWSCHVCTRERPDRHITVFSMENAYPDGVKMRVNVRHCADNQDCIDHAPNIAREWLGLGNEGINDGKEEGGSGTVHVLLAGDLHVRRDAQEQAEPEQGGR